MKEPRSSLPAHAAAISAISFLAVFAWNVLEARGTEYFWSVILLKGGFVLMVETMLWSFVIRYSKGQISNGQELSTFLVDQLIFIGLVTLLLTIVADIATRGFQTIHWLGMAAGLALAVFWMISKRKA